MLFKSKKVNIFNMKICNQLTHTSQGRTAARRGRVSSSSCHTHQFCLNSPGVNILTSLGMELKLNSVELQKLIVHFLFQHCFLCLCFCQFRLQINQLCLRRYNPSCNRARIKWGHQNSDMQQHLLIHGCCMWCNTG